MNDYEEELLAMLIDYPELFSKTMIKSNYFINKEYSKLFEILKSEYLDKKVLVPQCLIQNDEFNFELFTSLSQSNINRTNKDAKFNELEKIMIDNYKSRIIHRIIQQYIENSITYSKMFSMLQKVNELTFQNTSYLTSKDMQLELFSENKIIKFKYDKLTKNLNLNYNDLLIIAGNTGSGKTSFALNLLEDISNKYSCIYFNLEMSKNVFYKRLVSIQTKIALEELNDYKNLSVQKKEFIKKSTEKYEENKISLINTSQTLESIKRFILNYKTNKHLVVFIDHIGLIQTKHINAYERITEIAKELRHISLDCNCTVIALSQLSRESEKEDKPKLRHLRDSGEIEQSARKVILLNKKNIGNVRNQPMDIIIAKNDNGKVGEIGYIFDKSTQAFYENKDK